MATIHDFDAKLNGIALDVAEVKRAVVKIETSCGFCRNQIDDLEKSVYGNGSQGLKTTVIQQGQEIESMKKATAKDWGWLMKMAVLTGWLLTTACLIFGTFYSCFRG